MEDVSGYQVYKPNHLAVEGPRGPGTSTSALSKQDPHFLPLDTTASVFASIVGFTFYKRNILLFVMFYLRKPLLLSGWIIFV